MDQTAGMLDEDVQEKGYALLCVAQPQSDCTVQTIEEVRTWFSNRIIAHEMLCSCQHQQQRLLGRILFMVSSKGLFGM